MKKSKTSCLFLREYSLSDEELGAGAYSEVFSATRRSDGLKVAVKVIKATDLADLTALRNEVKIMKILLPNQVRRSFNFSLILCHDYLHICVYRLMYI